MIDLQQAYIRAYLDAVRTRITTAATILDWANGEQTLFPAELVPDFPDEPTAKKQAEHDWSRYKRQVQSLGPRILKTKRAGAIGEINWGGDNTGGIDQRLEQLDLGRLARNAFDPLACNGITAAWAYRDQDTKQVQMQALGGYLEPLYAGDDPNGEIVGLYQALASGIYQERFRVRVYDLTEKSIREWDGLEDPTTLDEAPTDEWGGPGQPTSVPRVAVYDTDQAGYAIGELAQALELLKSEVGYQLRILRVADAHAYPILWLAGAWDDPFQLGAQVVLRSSDAGAQAGRIEAGDLSKLFELQDRAMERLRADLGLPIGSIQSGSWPSGEALQQANVAYLTSSAEYARLLSTLLTGVVADYAELEGISDAPPVTINVNREQMRSVVSQQVRQDFAAGLISLRMALTAIAPYYPHVSSADIEAWVTEEAAFTHPPSPVPGQLGP